MASKELDVDTAGVRATNRTLKLALAMRGGVSLAVWIGGVVAELDLFRRACSGDLSTRVLDVDAAGRNENSEIHRRENQFRVDRAQLYREILRDHTHYTSVDIDILAGASAGGLNAVLYGLAQSCNAIMDDTVRHTWIAEGGIWDLLREPASLPVREPGDSRWQWLVKTPERVRSRGVLTAMFDSVDLRVPSIMQGNERLYTMVRDALGLIAGEDPTHKTSAPPPLRYTPIESRRAHTLSVELAATLLADPHNPGRGNRARFAFRKTPATLAGGYSTIPDADEADTPDGKRALDRMALAARSTSSFPGAFEPAAINSTIAADGAVPPELGPWDVAAGADVNMARAFPHARRIAEPTDEAEAFQVVDGGIFDNIPIDRAMRAIQRSPSSQPTERRLIYIDPEPPAREDPAGKPDSMPPQGAESSAAENPAARSSRPVAAAWMPVIRSSFALKQRNERAVDELSLVREHNDEVLQLRGRLEALAAAAGTVGGPSCVTDLARSIAPSAYVQCRIAMDTKRFAALLTDPWSELCYPPLRADDFVALAETEALRLKQQVAHTYNTDPLIAASLPGDLYALLDCVRVLLAWLHALEDITTLPFTGSRDLAEALEPIKRRLYRYATVLIAAKHHAVDRILTDPLHPSPAGLLPEQYKLGPLLDDICRAQDELTISVELSTVLVGESDIASFYEALSAWRTALPAPGRPFAFTVARQIDGIRASIRAVSAGVVQLANAATPGDDESARHTLQAWQESIFARLYGSAGTDDVNIETLARLFAITGIPGITSIVAFDQITSDAPSFIDMSRLAEGGRCKYLAGWLRKLPSEDQMVRVLSDERRVTGADAKLAGNAISRFGGFLSARWRENDWQWGRLDAAAGIVRLLDNTRSETRGDAALTADITTLQKSIKDESTASAPPPDGEAPIVETVGAETLDEIPAHYRFALASRIVPLISRALLPPRGGSASVADIARRTLLILVRPLTVPLPLVADPLRLVLAAVIIIGASGMLGAQNIPTWWHVAYAIALAALGGWIIWRARRSDKCWSKLGTLLERATKTVRSDQVPNVAADNPGLAEWREIYKNANRRHWRVFSYLLGIATVLYAAYEGLTVYAASSHAPEHLHEHPLIHESLSVEAAILVLLSITGLQHWFNRHTLRVPPRSREQDGQSRRRRFYAGLRVWRSPQWSRVIRVKLAIVAGIIAGVTAVLSSQSTAPFAVEPHATLRMPLMDAIAPQRLSTMADLVPSRWVALVTVALLVLISLWGWAANIWAIVTAAGCAVIAGYAQYAADELIPGHPYLPIFDILPAVMWMVLLGLVVQFIPTREMTMTKDPAPNTPYGERGRPLLIDLPRAERCAAGNDERGKTT